MRRLALVAALLVCALAACAKPPKPAPAAAPAPPSASRVLVAPMNLALPLATDLEDAVDPVQAALVRYLKDHRVQLATLEPAGAWELWRVASEALEAKAKAKEQAPPPPELVGSAVALTLARETRFDLLLIPSLVYRDARVEGRFAEWDGVRRRLRFRLRSTVPIAERRATEPTQEPVMTSLSQEWRGKITGLSLHVLLYTSEGRIAFQGFGGLDLVHEAVQQRQEGAEPVLRLQRELLGEPEHVREGVAVALDPFVAPRKAR